MVGHLGLKNPKWALPVYAERKKSHPLGEVLFSGIKKEAYNFASYLLNGGPSWTRTKDLTLIRGAL